jgi:copper resistance protein D
MTIWLVLTRAVHFGACLLFFGVFAFDRFVAASIFAGGETPAAVYWKTRVKTLIAILLPAILLSGIVWLVLVTTTMSGLPLIQAVQFKILETVWNQTQFGTVWKWRLIFWLASVAVAALFHLKTSPLPQKSLAWIQAGCGGLLLGSLAWAGHGQEDSPWHLAADVGHLLVAGFWPAGLLPLALLLRQLRGGSEPKRWCLIAVLIRRFSTLSLAAVALLFVTGLVNSWFLVGSVANLLGQPYGRWLLAKIILFCAAVFIGAVNLLRLKPRLLADHAALPTVRATARQLQFNVYAEVILGNIIIVIVAVLGILPPANR